MRSLLLSAGLALVTSASIGAEATTQEFAREVERILPVEKPYDFHRHLETSPVHMARRSPEATPAADELTLPDKGWRLVWCSNGGAMFGLYNLETRMNLREAPFLKSGLDTVRHSFYDVRMAQSWMGWMELSDVLLSRMAHDGFDAISASVLANPNGDRTAAETLQDRMEAILRDETARTERSFLAATRDSRLGFQQETDYVYTPYSIRCRRS